ncbi:MAG TPA: glycosyltransferase family protein [Patescibacteria group bacterium]
MLDKTVVAIIQARMGSTRLPGKSMKKILGKPMLWHIVQRVKKTKHIDKVVVATSTSSKDDKIVKFCKQNKIDYFRGSENNVLSRFYETATKFNAGVIVRITADCPLIDPAIIDQTIKKYLTGKYDYVSVATGAGVANKNVKRYPDGLDCEVFSYKILESAYFNAKSNDEKEHVTLHIWKRPKKFNLLSIKPSEDYSKLRFTVDHPSDLKFIKEIYNQLYPKKKNFNLFDIIALLKKYPKLLLINQANIGKEGYEKFWK